MTPPAAAAWSGAGDTATLAAPRRPRLMFYCQSSLGVGHTMRSLRLMEGLVGVFDVCFLNGGEAVAGLRYPRGLEVVDLPPVIADAEFASLRGADGSTDLADIFEQRCAIMLETARRFAPQVLMVELYPFGRRKFRRELRPLLSLARRGGARTVCSLRDILVPRRDQAEYEQDVVNVMNRYFDALLIHGDPRFQPLDDSFGRLADIDGHVEYTGYVAPAPGAATARRRSGRIIASIGGGRFGHELAFAVAAAAPLLAGRIHNGITLYTGPFCPPQVAAELRQLARGCSNLSVETFAQDLPERLQRAALSISLGGYNTTMDVLAAGVPAMMLACTNNGGMDQASRVAKLARLGAVEEITAADLAPPRLADRIVESLRRSPVHCGIDLGGVANTVAILRRLAAGRVRAARPL